MARILVVEDNPINLELMTYLLRAWGHETISATDGQAGLEAARRDRPDLVVCDIQMPGLDGYEVARALKADAALSSVPLVAVTAFAMVGDHDRALRAGFDGHFAKPIDPTQFMAELARFLPAGQAAPRPSPTPPQGEVAMQRPVRPELFAPAPGLVVLMVDDTDANLAFKLSLLEPAGYSVLTAGGGDEAFALARSRRVDLILSDVVMHDGSGFELLERVRSDAALHAMPFVFLTATARDDASRDRGLALGADAYLVRPIEPQSLLAELREQLSAG
ncbi:response regulator [Rhizobacter sp. AJA081-3]|jgi:two-component system cell cycle response regulator|uniref:response regulator n=1 Tax=Rhizobacter sp. AJA081-3 TaxID=2753607 RepID=UPI001ADFF127|nr:response regulator [Rhizobacter sp. AJA081-3]QTN24843.1 response regulator [Rhizobacter sp. AJA081-3]